jgi:alanine dehydrogenase
VTSPRPVLVLTGEDVSALLDPDACRVAVEQAFRHAVEGRATPPGVLGVAVPGGGFHVKAAALRLDRHYFAAKINGNLSENPARHGLPAIQGVIVLADAATGTPLAVLDSIEITRLRTAAASALAARHLARPGARVAAICGCGSQGRAHVPALLAVCPLERIYAFDRDSGQARRFAADVTAAHGVAVEVVEEPGAALARADVCVTCTPSRGAFVRRADVRPGTFVAAVGADSEDKQELEPALLASSTLVVDSLAQCAQIGELHHALTAGLMTAAGVHAELGEIVTGRKPGRTRADEVIVFDSTGTAWQDVAAAALVYERALAAGRGVPVALGS